jgi:protein TonB
MIFLNFRMLDTQDSLIMRLVWTGVAFFLHAALLFAMPAGTAKMPQIPSPIQVSLLDPSPMPTESEEPPAPPPPKPEPPRPKPVPRQEPKPQPVPEPLSDIPSPEPVAEVAPAALPVAETVASSSSSSSTASSDATASASDAPLVAANFDAAYLRNPKPPYPAISKKLHEEGRVELHVYVLADGNVGKVEIRRSSGYGRLDESAKTTVNRWRFSPGRRGDKAVDSWVIVPILFNLKES